MTESVQQFLEKFTSRSTTGAIDPESEESSLDVSLLTEGEVLYVLLRGELEFHHIERFKTAVAQELENPDCKQVVFHMGDVSFVDSTGLSCLVDAMQTVKARDGQVHLACCTPFIMKTLEITRLKRVFVIHETFDDAYNAANKTNGDA